MGAACSAIDIVDYGFNTLRSAASCVCFIACLGPILAIVGITMIVAPNHRADNVAKYNSAITTFAPQIATLTSTQGYVVSSPTVRMSPVSNTISISGDQSGVNSGTTVAVQSATSVYVSTLASPSVYLYIGTTGNATGNVVSGSLPQLARSGSKSYTCSYSSCGTSDITSYCTSRYSCSTSASRFCTSSSSSSSSGTSSSSSSSSSRSCTITCNYTEYLTSLCYAMSLTTTTPAKWVSSSLYNGCYYSSTSSTSFTSAQYSACTGTSNVALSFKSDLDPSFQLAIITGGTGDFGLTAGQQVALGAALLVIGLLFIGSGVALCCMARQMLQNQNNRSHMYAAFGRPPPGYVPYQTQPQLQPMMAVPPQQSYSPPTQGGYNQQPIMMQRPYGSPPYAAQQQPAQPMYGSPNAVPPVGYGAQPPPPGGYYQPPPPQQQAYLGQGGGAYYDPAYKPPNNGQFMGL